MRKMRAQAQACTCSGTEPDAQVVWSVHVDACETMPEREGSDFRGRSPIEDCHLMIQTGTTTLYLQEAEDAGLQAWRVPVEFSFRLIRRSI